MRDLLKPVLYEICYFLFNFEESLETVLDLFYVDCFEICFVEIVFDLCGEGYILSCVRPMEMWFCDFCKSVFRDRLRSDFGCLVRLLMEFYKLF